MFRAAIPALLVTGALRGLAGLPAAAQPAEPAAPAGAVVATFPSSPDPAVRYVVYLHGRIVEEQGRRAVSPEYGAYDYDGIVRALARPGIAVIGELRQKDADPKLSAAHVVDGVKGLIAAGVPASRITVVGASKGAAIAMLASTALPDRALGWVILSNCNEWFPENFEVALQGEVLSIYEASDEMAGTCGPIFAASEALARHDEVRLDTGLGHGYLYRPMKEWIEPALAWAERRSRK